MFTSFEKWLTFFEYDQIEVLSVANVVVYNFSTLAFFFWEKIAIEISVFNIHLVGLSDFFWILVIFLGGGTTSLTRSLCCGRKN